MNYYFTITSCNNCYYKDVDVICRRCVKHSKWAHFLGSEYIKEIIKKSEEKE